MSINNKRRVDDGVLKASKSSKSIKALPTKKEEDTTIKTYIPVSAKCDLTHLINAFDISKSKEIVLLSGPVGCGKTHAVESLASLCEFQMNTFDPSDNGHRDKMIETDKGYIYVVDVEQELRSVTSTKSCFTKIPSSKKVVFVDDAEGLTEYQCNGLISYLTNYHNPSTCCTIIIAYTTKNENIRKLETFATKKVVMLAPTPKELQHFGQKVKSICLKDVYTCSHECNGDIRQFKVMVKLISINASEKTLFSVDTTCTIESSLKKMLANPQTAAEISDKIDGSSFRIKNVLHGTLIHLHANKDFSIESLANTLDSITSASYGEYGNYAIGMIPSAHNIPYTNNIKSNNVRLDKQVVKKLSDSYKLYVS